jgi:hypothetical protein
MPRSSSDSLSDRKVVRSGLRSCLGFGLRLGLRSGSGVSNGCIWAELEYLSKSFKEKFLSFCFLKTLKKADNGEGDDRSNFFWKGQLLTLFPKHAYLPL